VLASYEADFAAMWGRRARDTLEEWGPHIFGISVSKRSSAADRWDIAGHRGGMSTAGVGGAITGRGANYLKVDDPIKNAQQAQSQAYRDASWDWWRSTARTRLEPDGVALVVATRWHEDDLIGRLLRAMEEDEQADQWVVIRFPAIAEEEDILGRKPGEALWRARYSEKELAQIRASVGSYVWAALYQQRPAPEEGGKFERGWLEQNVIVRPPEKLKRVVRYWDLAATDAKAAADPDWTVGAKVGLTKSNQYVILDVVRLRGSPAEVERVFRETTELDGRGVEIRIEEERGSAGKHIVSHYARNVVKGYPLRGVKVTGSKELRAEVAAAAAERGDLKLVRAGWNNPLVEEFAVFPFGTHDDQVDAVSGAVGELATKTGSGGGSW
jgi:predicted phage terminase large subunit-like protein